MPISCKKSIFIALALLLLRAPHARAQDGRYEYQIGAILNFAKFVEWPTSKFAQPDSPVIIGIIGADPFHGLLDEANQDRKVANRKIVVRHVTSTDDMRRCHVLYVSRSERDRFAAILNQVRRNYVLTVGDDAQFVLAGGIINFIDGPVHFQINSEAARKTGVRISSKLLQVAQVVGSDGRIVALTLDRSR